MNAPTLIIGKHGKTGRRVEALLQAAGLETRGVSRSTQPAFDWEDSTTWLNCMKGCKSAYVSFQPDLAIPAAQTAIREFIEVAKVAGLEHIVLLSGRGETGAQKAEQQLIHSGLTWNVVRASWFHQNFSEGFLIEGILNGQVALPAGDIQEPFIDADDIAEVALNCLTKPELHNQLFEVTGPELLTFKECVNIISQISEQPIEFIPITAEQLIGGLKQQGQPEGVLWLMNELFTQVMDGRNSQIHNDVEKVLGRPAKTFLDYTTQMTKEGTWYVNNAEATC